MKRLGILAILGAVLFSVNAYACDSNKKGDKGKSPQTQTTTTAPAGPVANDTKTNK